MPGSEMNGRLWLESGIAFDIIQRLCWNLTHDDLIAVLRGSEIEEQIDGGKYYISIADDATSMSIYKMEVTEVGEKLKSGGVIYPDSKVHGANMGLIWGRQDPGGPHVGPVNIASWVVSD